MKLLVLDSDGNLAGLVEALVEPQHQVLVAGSLTEARRLLDVEADLEVALVPAHEALKADLGLRLIVVGEVPDSDRVVACLREPISPSSLRPLLRLVDERLRLEHKLIDAEARLRLHQAEPLTVPSMESPSLPAALSALDVAFALMDREWRYLFVNNTASNWARLAPEAMLGRTIWDVFPHAVGTSFQTELERAAARNRQSTFVRESPIRDTWFEHRVFPTPDWIAILSMDVTEAKQAEFKARERQKLFRALFEETDVLFALLDAEGTILEVNPRATDLLGLPREQMAGRAVWDCGDWDRCSIGGLQEGVRQAARGQTNRSELRPGPFILECTFSPVDHGGQIVQVILGGVDVTERRRSEQALRILADAGQKLSRSLDYQTTLREVCQVLARALGDFCFFDLVEDGVLRRLASAHRQSDREEQLLPLARFLPSNLESPHPIARVVKSAEPLLVLNLDTDWIQTVAVSPEHALAIQRVQPGSLLSVPVVAAGQVLGALTCCRHLGSPAYDATDLELAQELGRRAATAVSNARLYQRVQERESRFRLLAEAGAELAGTLDYREALTRVTRLTVPILADWALVHLFDEQGGLQLLAVAHPETTIPEDPEKPPPLPPADYGPYAVAHSGRSQMIEEVTDAILENVSRGPEHLQLMRSLGFASYLCVPLKARDRVLGALSLVMSRSGRRYTPRDLELGEELAARAALAVDNALLYHRAQEELKERRKSELAARESEERFRNLADSAPVLIWMSGPEKEGVYFNRAWLEFTGRTLEQELGEGWASSIHPDDVAETDRVCRQCFEQRSPLKHEFRMRRHDGVYRWMLDTGVPRYASDGDFVGYIGNCVDITETRQAAEELARARDEAEKASRMKTVFLANMSHEIRTPLNGIRGMVELLADTDLEPTQADYLKTIQMCFDSLLSVIDDVLDLSRIEAGKLEIRNACFELVELVHKAASLFQMQASEKGLSFQLELDPELPARVEGDPDRIRQVLVNLISNAVKFTDKGRVVLRVFPKDRGLRFEVEDTGPGIPRQARKQLFKPFRQLDPSSTRRHGGSGLGLSIVKRLVELMRGRVGLRSGKGKGSVFWVELPLSATTAPVLPSEAAPPAAEVDADLRVLVVEDNPINRRVISLQLEKMGYRVEVAADGVEALAHLSEPPPDLVLMDCQMPRLDGYETTRRIRQSSSPWKEVVVVALTAHAMKGEQDRCFEAGMDDYLRKPVSADELRRVLESWARRRTARPHSDDALKS